MATRPTISCDVMARDNGKRPATHLVVENRKARHDFFIEETYEAGLALVGTEVKALRAHKANLRDSYARVKDGELFLHGIHIGAYAPAGQFSHKETRPRKLLLHRREINRLWGRVRERGYSIVPLQIYFKDGRAKVETVDDDSAARRRRTQCDRKRAHPGDAAQERAWSASRLGHHAFDGCMKSSWPNPEAARCRKHALLIDQPLAIERVEDQCHETRGVKQRARHVAGVTALRRLDRDRKLEGRIEKMLDNHRASESRWIYGDLPLELSQL